MSHSVKTNALMTVPPRLKRATRPPRGTSPLIEELERVAATGKADLGAFWRGVEETGTPIVGELDDDGHRTATFLWRGGDELADVVLVANKIADADSYDENRMDRVPGTDVWHLTYRMRSDWRASYTVAPVPADGSRPPENALSAMTRLRRERALAVAEPDDRSSVARWFDALTHARPDPRSRERLDEHHSVVSLPEAPAELRHRVRGDARAGEVTEHRVASRHLDNTRTVWVHRPAVAPAEREPWPVVVLLDGRTWHDLPLAPLLDGLIAEGALPPMLTVMVDSLDPGTRMRELACHDPFVSFLDTELPAWLRNLHPITDDPERTLVAGQSLGGLTSLYAALRAPERFGRVLSQSGSYWWPNVAGTGGESEHMVHLSTEADTLPGRVHLSAGLHEWALIGANRRVHEALCERGTELGRPNGFATLTEYNGGHDRACWRVDLPDGLVALTDDWPRPTGRA
ncbi:enterochelin esterase [Nocardiopsis sp. JB363]|uniref:enterochelin esterase n=1 Tax=Nocardiopsis sp. JB363 TaxID=1434837 RepID=UPI001F1A5373|nr:enterochelin esterase [Nocardiopsis sp. JB363]